MTPFRRRRRGGITAAFEPGEAHLLANFAGQVIELLQDRSGPIESDPDPLAAQLGLNGPSTPPEDPVLQRLLPDAYRDDPADAAEFRVYTERSLTDHKAQNAKVLIDTLFEGGMVDSDIEDDPQEARVIEVELDPGEAQSWLRCLTDIRLALAVRLGIETDEDIDALRASEDDATAAMTGAYDYLSLVQESLVQALD